MSADATADAGVTAPAEATPERIGEYGVERLLVDGAMGAVYLVRSPILRRREVLKVLNPALAGDPRMLARFHREADITASLEHPNIVRVYSRGDTGGQQWIAMEYIPGSDAETALRTSGPMPATRVAHILTDVARALDAAHRDGVVHQDIKPSNILLGEQPGEPERVVLSDFGAALISDATADYARAPMTATLAYAAPEVITGDIVDARADIYSLGCTAFRLLTGQHPFPGNDDAAAMIRAHLDTTPPRISAHLPWATAELDTVLATAMAKDPAQRYRRAGQFAAAMSRALQAQIATEIRLAGSATPAAAPPAVERQGTPPSAWSSPAAATDFLDDLPRTQPVSSSRRRLVLAGLAAMIGMVGLGAGLVLSGRSDAPETAEQAASSATPTSTETAPTADPAANARLATVLPPGYPPGRCTPAPPNQPGAAAVMSCGPNIDPGGPPAATYTLARDRGTLQTLFTDTMGTAETVVCPGNIASPGAWYHLVAPTVPVGTVFCGLRADRSPVVAWTTDEALLLSVVEAQTPEPPTLQELYTWWTAHS